MPAYQSSRTPKKGVSYRAVLTGSNLIRERGEQGFDKLFGYKRELPESFEYCNTMKNGTVTDKLWMQERELKAPKQDFAGEKKKNCPMFKQMKI